MRTQHSAAEYHDNPNDDDDDDDSSMLGISSENPHVAALRLMKQLQFQKTISSDIMSSMESKNLQRSTTEGHNNLSLESWGIRMSDPLLMMQREQRPFNMHDAMSCESRIGTFGSSSCDFMECFFPADEMKGNMVDSIDGRLIVGQSNASSTGGSQLLPKYHYSSSFTRWPSLDFVSADGLAKIWQGSQDLSIGDLLLVDLPEAPSGELCHNSCPKSNGKNKPSEHSVELVTQECKQLSRALPPFHKYVKRNEIMINSSSRCDGLNKQHESVGRCDTYNTIILHQSVLDAAAQEPVSLKKKSPLTPSNSPARDKTSRQKTSKGKNKRKISPDEEQGIKKYITGGFTDNDVLMGRGGGVNHHPGNKAYLQQKDSMQQEPRYIVATKNEKTGIAQDLVKWVHARGGRFLNRDDDDGGKWYEVDAKTAHRKASQTLREKNTPEKRAHRRAKYKRDV